MNKYVFPYQEQLDRIKRLEEDLQRFSISSDDNFETAIDTFTSFFIQCYHLRDWLIESRYGRIDIDIFISESFALSLCRDMANKQKHKTIDKYEPQNHLVEHKVDDSNILSPIIRYYDPHRKENRFGVDVEEYGTLIDVLDLADKCISEWERFLYIYSI
jgi:citrate lyase synthetase